MRLRGTGTRNSKLESGNLAQLGVFASTRPTEFIRAKLPDSSRVPNSKVELNFRVPYRDSNPVSASIGKMIM